NVELDRGRQLLPEGRQQIANGIDDRDRVRAGLPLDRERDDLLSVVACCEPAVLDAINHVAEIAQRDRRAVAISDDQLAILVGICQLSVRLNRQVLMNAVERAYWQVC